MTQAEMVLEEARISTLPDPNSLGHLMTHLPKHPDCRACQIAKMKASHCRRVPNEQKEKITKFGRGVTADTLVAKNTVSTSYEGSKYAIVWYDEGTGWREAAPDANRNISAARKAFRQLAGPRAKIDSFYCDNAGELTKAAEELDLGQPNFYSATLEDERTSRKASATCRAQHQGWDP